MSNSHPYPTPVHDVLNGFDWIVQNLLPKRAITRVGRAAHVGKLAVCGELIGGGLATMLALTECRRDEAGILATAVNNPLVDWVSLHQAESVNVTKEQASTAQSDAILDLIRLRKRLFKKPEQYFDPFASPLLFFRSAGVEVPPAPPDGVEDDMEQLSILEREYANSQDFNSRQSPRLIYQTDDDIPAAKRRTSRRFPSQALGLRLPSFHVSTGSKSPLLNQSKELTHLLRQSIVRQSKYSSSSSSAFGRKILLDNEADQLDEDEKAVRRAQNQEAEEKAQFASSDGFAPWNESAAGEERVIEVARWLNNRLS